MSLHTADPAALVRMIDHDDGIIELRLFDPATRNSLSDRMMQAIHDAHLQIEARPDARVLILTGEGNDFCAGGNIDDMHRRSGVFSSEDPFEARRVNRDLIHLLPRAIHGLSMPTIAAVDGHAIGGGCDLALMCDIRIASDRAVFGESFLRVGLLPGDGGAWFLPRVVGLSRAMEMVLTSDFIDAASAERIGLVSRIIPAARLLDEALALARRIARQPPTVARMSKQLLRFGAQASLADTLEMTANMQAQAQTSKEHRDAVGRLVERLGKKPPSKP